MKQAAKSVIGVQDCSASYKNGTAEVTFDPSKTTPNAIAKVITEKTGYKATAPSKPRSL